MPRGIEHDPQPAGAPVCWLMWSLTASERHGLGHCGLNVTHPDLEVHHLRLRRHVFGPHGRQVPEAGGGAAAPLLKT